MRAFKNFNEVPEYTENVKLPVGAYKITIIKVKEQFGQNNSCALCILFDIAEGEYKDYYRKKFEADKKAYPETAKFKGMFKLWYPNGGQFDESAERKMKTNLKKIKDSNNLNVDFTKEWNGAVLKNCMCGMVFREQEYDFNGYSGMSSQPYRIITLEELETGKFTVPKPKYLNENSKKNTEMAQYDDDFKDIPYDYDDDLPF